MKRAVILHGTDANPESNWFPWLKQKLEAEGYQVWAPLLPENDIPSWELYGNFLFNSDWDFSDNIVIGHSSGAVEVLNMLMDDRCPKVKLAVCVSAWDHGVPAGMEDFKFARLFHPKGYDLNAIKAHADKIVFIHGDDDPYCPLEQGEYLAHALNASIEVVPNGHRLGAKYTELPETWEIIEREL